MPTVIESGIQRIQYAGQTAWRKCHGGGSRRWRLRALDLVVRALGLTALRPPPHPVGGEASAIELRRLSELSARGVRVPRVLAQDTCCLVLSDLGPTLASVLRESDPDTAARWFSLAAAEIARIHSAGAYLGQPQARNMAIDGQGHIGFLDFEEDPLEVMSLEDAQVRDWLLFMAGTVRHVPHDAVQLGQMLQEPLSDVPEGVREKLSDAVSRLGFIAGLNRFEGRRAGGLGKAVKALRYVVTSWAALLLLLGLGVDYLHDGELEIVQLIALWFE